MFFFDLSHGFYIEFLYWFSQGMDCEWRPTFKKGEVNPVATLQLSSGIVCVRVDWAGE